MSQVTGEEVLAAMKAANIDRVDHHDCGGCGHVVFFTREDDRLLFNPDCKCTVRPAPPEPRSWQNAADWINIQSAVEVRNDLRARFGMLPE